jgi:hypothetical protein
VKNRKKSRRGESGSVTITETRFSAGLARVKAKALSGSGRVSRVGSGYGSGNRDKAFSLSGSDRVSRVMSGYGSGNGVKGFSLSWSDRVSRVRIAGLSGLAGLVTDKVKTSPRAGFILIPKLGPG